MIAVEIALWVVLVPLAASSLYLAGLALLSLIPDRSRPANPATRTRFAVIVPAHNEESRLPALLASIRDVDYPSAALRVVVVADNCGDGTAAAARRGGVDVVERHDDTRVGKGYALEFGLKQVAHDFDAVVFLDADCSVTPNILQVFDGLIDRGEHVMQAYYTMTPSAESSTRALRELAMCLVHRLRPRAKSRFGGSAGIKGSGMCFTRGAIERVGWSSFGLAEDIEQHNRVLRAGMRVAFAGEATVTGAAPDSLHDASGQHARWEAGRATAARRDALPLLVSGIRRRSIAMIDAAVEMLVPPISVVAAGLIACVVTGFAFEATAATVVAAAGIGALALYVVCGAVVARMSVTDAFKSALAAPRYVAWKSAVYIRALVFAPGRWESTHRD